MIKLKTKLEKEDIIENEKDLPLATMVINEYRLSNENLRETLNNVLKIKRILIVLIMFLLILTSAMASYIIIYWDTMNPHVGAIQYKSE